MGYDAVRTERYTYIAYRELQGMDELYDVVSDPFQMDNLIGTPKGDSILRRCAASWSDCSARHCRRGADAQASRSAAFVYASSVQSIIPCTSRAGTSSARSSTAAGCGGRPSTGKPTSSCQHIASAAAITVASRATSGGASCGWL